MVERPRCAFGFRFSQHVLIREQPTSRYSAKSDMADQQGSGLSPRLSRTCNLCKERKVRCMGTQPWAGTVACEHADGTSRGRCIILCKLHCRLIAGGPDHYVESIYTSVGTHHACRSEKYRVISQEQDERSGSLNRSHQAAQ